MVRIWEDEQRELVLHRRREGPSTVQQPRRRRARRPVCDRWRAPATQRSAVRPLYGGAHAGERGGDAAADAAARGDEARMVEALLRRCCARLDVGRTRI
eukprot:6186320-Prymnesium_polylepis.2